MGLKRLFLINQYLFLSKVLDFWYNISLIGKFVVNCCEQPYFLLIPVLESQRRYERTLALQFSSSRTEFMVCGWAMVAFYSACDVPFELICHCQQWVTPAPRRCFLLFVLCLQFRYKFSVWLNRQSVEHRSPLKDLDVYFLLSWTVCRKYEKSYIGQTRRRNTKMDNLISQTSLDIIKLIWFSMTNTDLFHSVLENTSQLLGKTIMILNRLWVTNKPNNGWINSN